MKYISKWFAGSVGIVFLFSVLLIVNWERFPIFLDLYYHAGCMAGFEQAGGIALHDFWNYAPVGRPHLYPPVLSIIMLFLLKAGLGPISIMRFLSVTIYPSLLITIWLVVKSLYSERQAFFTVLISSIPYTFFLTVVNAIPASLALIILLLLFYAVEKKKLLAGVLLMGLSFYTHAGLPWITCLALAIYGLLNRKNFKIILFTILCGIIIGSPWLIHIINNREYFFIIKSYENRYFEGNLLLYIFFVIGALIAIKRRARFCFPLALLIAMLPMLINYKYRFLCGQGLLPLIILGGLGLDGIYETLNKFFKAQWARPLYTTLLPVVIFCVLIFFSPTVSLDEGRFGFSIDNSTYANLTRLRAPEKRGNESTIYFDKFTKELVEAIKTNSNTDDIIYCNYEYFGGLLYVLTGRAASSGMLNEVRPFHDFNPILPAKLIIWLKNPEGVFEPTLKTLIEKLNLEKIKETEIAYIYRNPLPTANADIVKALFSTKAVILTLIAWIGILILFFLL